MVSKLVMAVNSCSPDSAIYQAGAPNEMRKVTNSTISLAFQPSHNSGVESRSEFTAFISFFGQLSANDDSIVKEL